jgi:hypothetical protein
MKHSFKKILQIECTLDSSEAIMFTKGGKHSLKLMPYDQDEDEHLNLDSYNIIEISFQMDKSDMPRFDFVTSEAKKHREQWDKINEEERIKPQT